LILDKLKTLLKSNDPNVLNNDVANQSDQSQSEDLKQQGINNNPLNFNKININSDNNITTIDNWSFDRNIYKVSEQEE